MQSRREFLGVLSSSVLYLGLFPLVACERSSYERPEEDLDLGTVKELLFKRYHARSRSVLVFRDKQGWSALSLRCTYEGCDLSVQDSFLLCPCCRSAYDFTGQVYSGGKSKRALPWLEMFYREGHLFARVPRAGKNIDSSYRFTTVEIEEAISARRERYTDELVGDTVKVPPSLSGQAREYSGQMFIEEESDLARKLDKTQ